MKRLLAAFALALAPWLAFAQMAGGIMESQRASGVTIGTTPITGGATTQVLYNLAGVVSSSADFVYNDTTKILTVGATTNGATTGIRLGNIASGSAGMWNAFIGSYGFKHDASGNVFLNASPGASVLLQANGGTKTALSSTAGEGISITAGTAVTDVAALSITRTNNNAAVATGVLWTFTDTTSAAGFLPFQIKCGAAGTTNCFSVDKSGGLSAAAIDFSTGVTPTKGWYSTGTNIKARISGFDAMTVDAANFTTGVHIINGGAYYNSTGNKIVISQTAPTIASGGCTSPTVTNTNGTVYFTIDVGTSCSGSQPVVFTLPAATTGWRCEARNISNAAGSAPAQSGAVSTTSVTITNYSRTTGAAAAWTDGDDVQVMCLGG